ncbi:MAG: PQQ-dependent sugar dehydrogenase [Verrucomicrobiales bacterium]
MRFFLFSITTKLILFALSVGIGIGGYVAVQLWTTHHQFVEPQAINPAALAAHREMAFDAEPSLMARAESPTDLGGDALGVSYVLERGGDVLRISPSLSGAASVTPYCSLADSLTETSLGFSGIAFHPHFLAEGMPGFGKFYVVAAEKPGSGSPDFQPEFGTGAEHHQDVVYEYSTRHPLAPTFEGGKREVLRFSQPGPENNLRSLVFDFQGGLYLGVGDGAVGKISRKSASRNASSLASAYGKVLRIDPTGRDGRNGRYGIPETNPFKLVTEALPELWAFGLRAPHSLSFDPFQGSLCIGEAGRDGVDEVNLSAMGGEHFGWDLTESSTIFSMSMNAQLAEIVTSPIAAFDRRAGMAGRTIGNVVYRGENFPSLAGRVIVASHDGRLIAVDQGENSGNTLSLLEVGGLTGKKFTALRTGPSGELVVLCEDGSVYEMRKSRKVGGDQPGKKSLFCGSAAAAPTKG